MIMALGQAVSGQAPQKVDWRLKGKAPNATFYEVEQSFQDYWAGRTSSKKGQGYKVFKRWENYMKPRVYPSGNMALTSMTYTNFMDWSSQQGSSKTTAGNWTEMGPNTLPTGYDAGAGRINFVRFDPVNPSIIYVSSPDGGLWKTTNDGTTWTSNSDFLPVIGCTDLAIDPGNTQVMYLATGDKEGDRRSIGVLKSTNGGSTWNSTSLVFTAIDNYSTTRLLMDPTNPNVMLLSTDGGIFKTTDGWASHSQVETSHIEDMEFKPGDPNVVYAAGFEVLKSTDRGNTWSLAAGLPNPNNVSRIVLGVSPANPAYVYAIVGDSDNGFEGFYRSVNSGSSYTLRSSTPNILHASANPGPSDTGGQAFHDLAIAVSPTDEDFVTIGGINQWQSDNGGSTWTRITYWLGYDANYPGSEQEPEPYIHADIQDIQYLPGSSSTFFSSCDGGISKTTDEGFSWTNINGNLAISQMTSISLSSTTAGLAITGLQDIGSLKQNAGNWSVIGGGDGEDGFIDWSNDMNMVYSTVEGAFFLSFDGGVTYSDVTGLPSGGEWFSPIHQDPIVATTVYAGGFPSLYRSQDLLTNANYSWTQLGAPAGTGNILRFEIAPSNNSVMYAIKIDAISKSTNGGASWTDVTGSLPAGTVAFSNLAVSDSDPDHAWAVFSGYDAASKVFETTDGGSTWTNISAGLPNIPINTIVYTNGNPNDAIYIGADIGIFYLDNSLASWVSFATGIPNCAVTDLEIFYPSGKIRAATYGRGAWESDLYSPSTSIARGFENKLKLYPNPVLDQLTIELEGNTSELKYEILDVNGRMVAKGQMVDKAVIGTSQFAAGAYIIRLNNEHAYQFEKVIKQ